MQPVVPRKRRDKIARSSPSWAVPIAWVGTPGTKKEPPPVKVCASFIQGGKPPSRSKFNMSQKALHS